MVSSKLFHAPQAGHLPSQRGLVAPQLLQVYWDLGEAIVVRVNRELERLIVGLNQALDVVSQRGMGEGMRNFDGSALAV